MRRKSRDIAPSAEHLAAFVMANRKRIAHPCRVKITEDEMAAPGFRFVEGRFELTQKQSRAIAEAEGSFPELAELVIYRTASRQITQNGVR